MDTEPQTQEGPTCALSLASLALVVAFRGVRWTPVKTASLFTWIWQRQSWARWWRRWWRPGRLPGWSAGACAAAAGSWPRRPRPPPPPPPRRPRRPAACHPSTQPRQYQPITATPHKPTDYCYYLYILYSRPLPPRYITSSYLWTSRTFNHLAPLLLYTQCMNNGSRSFSVRHFLSNVTAIIN